MHRDRGAANDQLRSMRGSKRASGLEVYRCKLCDHWHVGHPPGMATKHRLIRRGMADHKMPRIS